MAQPSDKPQGQTPQGEFLGGSVKFNTVGGPVQPVKDADPAADDPGPVLIPTRVPARALVIILVIVLLMGVLYWINDRGPGGVVHTSGRGGISPDQKPSAPPKNF